MEHPFKTPDQIELDALRGEVSILLRQCTEKQRAFFSKVFPCGVENMDRDKLRTAVGLCQRTISKNETGNLHGKCSVTRG